LISASFIRELQRDGYSMRGIAAELEKHKVATPRGGEWNPRSSQGAFARL
jgi:hypothetical protein